MPPFTDIIVHRRPRWEVAGQLTPLTACLAQAQLTGAPHLGARQQRLDHLPSTVAEVAGVAGVAGVTSPAVLPSVFLWHTCNIREKHLG